VGRGPAWQAWGVILGIGVDVVDISRMDEALRRTPALASRLFTEGERGRAPASLAACFAAKEAVAKALGGPAGRAGPMWRSCTTGRAAPNSRCGARWRTPQAVWGYAGGTCR